VILDGISLLLFLKKDFPSAMSNLNRGEKRPTRREGKIVEKQFDAVEFAKEYCASHEIDLADLVDDAINEKRAEVAEEFPDDIPDIDRIRHEMDWITEAVAKRIFDQALKGAAAMLEEYRSSVGKETG